MFAVLAPPVAVALRLQGTGRWARPCGEEFVAPPVTTSTYTGASMPSPSPIGVGASAAAAQEPGDRKLASAEQLVLDLCDRERRENALLELSKVRRVSFYF